MQKRVHDFKLPQIRRSQKEGIKAMSKTSGESTNILRTRPSSSTKVQDLEKVLFSKLDSYDGGSKKHIAKRGGKSSKLIEHECSTGTQSTPEGYEKMQKMMPGLYSKLIEVKKANFVQEVPPKSQLQQVTVGTNSKKEKSIQVNPKRGEGKTPFVTGVALQQELQIKQKEPSMSELQIDAIFQEYLTTEGLAANTTNKEMEDLGASIVVCEKGIEELRQQMSKMIQELQVQCLSIEDNYDN